MIRACTIDVVGGGGTVEADVEESGGEERGELVVRGILTSRPSRSLPFFVFRRDLGFSPPAPAPAASVVLLPALPLSVCFGLGFFFGLPGPPPPDPPAVDAFFFFFVVVFFFFLPAPPPLPPFE